MVKLQLPFLSAKLVKTGCQTTGGVSPWHRICFRDFMNMVLLEIIVGLLGIAAFNVVYTETLRFLHHREAKSGGARLSRTQTPHFVTLHAFDLK